MRENLVAFFAFASVIVLPAVVVVEKVMGPPSPPEGLTGSHIERQYAELFELLSTLPSEDSAEYERAKEITLSYVADDESIVRFEFRGSGRVFVFDRGDHSEYNCFGREVLGCEINPRSLFPVKSVMYEKRIAEHYVAKLYIDYQVAATLAGT